MTKNKTKTRVNSQRREKLTETFKGIFVLGLIFAFPLFAKKVDENKPRKAVWG